MHSTHPVSRGSGAGQAERLQVAFERILDGLESSFGRARSTACRRSIRGLRLGTNRGHAGTSCHDVNAAATARLSREGNRPSQPHRQLGQALDGVNERLAINVDEAVEGALLAKPKLVRNLPLPR
jgi:hypothetical protein